MLEYILNILFVILVGIILVTIFLRNNEYYLKPYIGYKNLVNKDEPDDPAEVQELIDLADQIEQCQDKVKDDNTQIANLTTQESGLQSVSNSLDSQIENLTNYLNYLKNQEKEITPPFVTLDELLMMFYTANIIPVSIP